MRAGLSTRASGISAIQAFHRNHVTATTSDALAAQRSERVEGWERAKTMPAHLAMRGLKLSPRPPLPAFAYLEEEVGNIGQSTTVCGDLRLVRWRFTGELLDLPSDFEQITRSATLIRLEVDDGLGGDFGASMRVIELLTELRTKVQGVLARGKVCSAHAALFTACPGRRYVARNASLNLHSVITAVMADPAALRAAAENLERLEGRLAVLLARRAGISVRAAWRWGRPGRDMTLTPEAAVANRLADEVVDLPPYELGGWWPGVPFDRDWKAPVADPDIKSSLCPPFDHTAATTEAAVMTPEVPV